MINNGETVFHYANEITPEVFTQELAVCNCGYYMAEHSAYLHNRFEEHGMLLYLQEGNATVTINNKRHRLTGGSVTIFLPNTKQHIYYHDDERNVRYYIYFNGTGVKKILETLHLDGNFFATGTFEEIPETTKNLIEDFKLNGFNNLLYKKILLMNLFAKTYEKSRAPAKTTFYKVISPALQHMERHFKDKMLSADEYANMCGVSKVTFVKYFKIYKNATPSKFFTALKITNAQLQLTNTNKTISEIAYDIGFDDPLYFSRVFKNVTGESPSDFRKKRF